MESFKTLPLRFGLILCVWLTAVEAKAQFMAVVVDAETGEPLPAAVAKYDDHEAFAIADMDGRLTLPIMDGQSRITVTCLGYTQQHYTVNYALSKQNAIIKMYADALMIGEVVVKPQKQKYKRKNNPAVELMRRVMDTKDANNIERNENYSLRKYTKHTVGVNEVSPKTFKKGLLSKFAFLKDHAETCPETGKLIVPLTVDETMTKEYHLDNKKNVVVEGKRSDGFTSLFNIGDFFTTYIKDIFTDINIYDDNCRVLQHPFISPLAGTEAITFYHYFIVDTLDIGGQKCINIAFTPSNVQDFGFSGNLYVTAEPSPVIKRCVLNIPKLSGVNFVENLIITQDFTLLSDGTNVLKRDNMVVELRYTDDLIKFHAQRLSVYDDFQFGTVTAQHMARQSAYEATVTAEHKDADFWEECRKEPLSETEHTIGNLLSNAKSLGGYKYVMFLLKAVVENSVELTKAPNKVDLLPINTIYSSNYVDGTRFRLGGQTTANLNPHLFFRGYGAYGLKDEKAKYKLETEYSFVKKKYMAHEFPRRSVVATFMYDDMSPVDKFSGTDKDNMYTSVKTSKVEHMMYVKDLALKFNYETDLHFLTSLTIDHSNTSPAGKMTYLRTTDGRAIDHIDNTSAKLTLRWAPGELNGNSKQQRLPINNDAPILTIEHTTSCKGLMHTDYTSNITEASLYKRFWLPLSFGNIDLYMKGGVQWNKVPFPYLFIPSSNLSYFIQFDNWSFCLLDNMEFLNDRYASLFMNWNFDGKIFNRIPLLRKLKLREYVGFKILYGKLSDRNNPNISPSKESFYFPTDDGQQMVNVMGNKPYMEFSAGISNIFKFLTIQYVRRLNYTSMPDRHVKKNGIRFAVEITF